MTLTVPSYAKINWFLVILGRRADGLHELVTLLQTIDLHDTLEFQCRSDKKVLLRAEGIDVPTDESNLVTKAARALQPWASSPGVEIMLTKRIPVEAGLGGGSSNAAAALAGLNDLWGCGLSRSRLSRIGARIGSDVPFFLYQGTCLAAGRGERIEPLDDLWPGMELVLVLPDFGLSTAEVYRRVAAGPVVELTTRREDTRIQPLLAAARTGDWSRLVNELEPAAQSICPKLQPLADSVRSCGAGVMLCGSGSTLLALGGPDALQEVENRIGGLRGVRTVKCRVQPRDHSREAT